MHARLFPKPQPEGREVWSSSGEFLGVEGQGPLITHNSYEDAYNYSAASTPEGMEIITSSGESLGIKGPSFR